MSEYGDPAVARAFWLSVPPPLRAPLQAGIWLYIVGFLLDIGQMICSIMAIGGRITDTDPKATIVFPPIGRHIQYLIIAWASLGIVAHMTLLIMLAVGVSSKAPTRDEKQYARARGFLLKWFLPWSVLSLAVWGICVGVQSGRYVPDLSLLPVCARYPGLSQCGMVFASWVIGLVYLALHLGLLVWISVVLRRFRMSFIDPGNVGTRLTETGYSRVSNPQRIDQWLEGGEDMSGTVSSRLRAEWDSRSSAPPPYSKLTMSTQST